MDTCKITKILVLNNMVLLAKFENNKTKKYDLKKLCMRYPVFQDLRNNNLFKLAKIDAGGYGIAWNELLDLSCSEIWKHGESVEETNFDEDNLK